MFRDKQSIHVTIRVRPLSEKQLYQDSRMCLKVQQQTHSVIMNNGNDSKKFTFDQICDNDTQQDMFRKVGVKSTLDCLEGYNCTIFAYGQTGAGKTFTMMGVNYESQKSYQLRGLIPRTLQYLFHCINEDVNQNQTQYSIRCHFLQIYNEQIMDLLNKSNTNLNLRQDTKKGVYVQGVDEFQINSPQDALQLLKKGSRGRHVGSTCYNENSSRSHSVFTMHIESKSEKNGIANFKSRYFHFIDLAGSERTKMSVGDRLKQGCSINKSLHVLGKVIKSLGDFTQGKAKHVNYRDSKLTFLLKDSLRGNSKTRLIANIHAGIQSYSQTFSTLVFARCVKMIKLNKAAINEESSGNIEALKKQIKRLRQEIIQIKSASASEVAHMTLGIAQEQTNGKNVKMTKALTQFISEKLQQQCKIQSQVGKMQAKLQNLQKGIKLYSQNEIHLRMIIKVYEQKLKRVKLIQDKIFNNINNDESLQLSNEDYKEIAHYVQSQRKSMLQEIKHFKDAQGKNAHCIKFIKDVLAQNKEKQTNQVQNVLDIITRNNSFFNEMKEFLQSTEKISAQGASEELKEKQAQFTKRQEQNLFKIDQLNIDLTQVRALYEQSQNLLKETVDHQLNLESKVQSLQRDKQQLIDQSNFEKKKFQNLQKQYINFKETQSNIQSEIKIQNAVLKTQINSLQSESSQLKAKIQQIQSEKLKQVEEQLVILNNLEELMSERSVEAQKLKQQNVNLMMQREQYKQKNDEITSELQKLSQKNTQLKQYMQKEKIDMKEKMEKLKQKHQLTISELSKEVETLKKSLTMEEDLYKKLQENLAIKQSMCDQNQRQIKRLTSEIQQHKQIYEERQAQLMKMIHQKQSSGHENYHKLNTVQMQLMKTQDKLIQSQRKVQRQSEQLKEKIKKYVSIQKQLQKNIDTQNQIIKALLEANKQKQITLLQKQRCILSYNQKLKMMQQQFAQSNEQIKQMQIELTSSKDKEKELKVNYTNLKNQMYANQKNQQIQLQAVKELLKKKQLHYEKIERQTHRSKQTLQKNIAELERQVQRQKQLLIASQQSLRKAMQTHLTNKENQIYELKSSLSCNQQQLQKLKYNKQSLQRQVQQKNNQLHELYQGRKKLQSHNKQLKEDIESLKEQLEETDHRYQENQLQYNQQLDSKNMQINNLVKDLQASKDNHEKQLLKLQEIICSNKNTIKDWENRYSKLTKQLQLTKNSHKSVQNTISQLQQQISEQKSIVAKYQSKIKETVTVIQQQKGTHQLILKQKNSDMEDLQTKVELYYSKINQNQKKIQNLHQDSIQKAILISQLEQKYQIVIQDNKSLQEQIQQLNEEIKSYKEQAKRKEKVAKQQIFNRQQKNKEDLDALKEYYGTKMSQKDSNISQLSAQIKHLKKLLSERQQEIKQRSEKMKQELAKMVTRENDLLENIKNLENQRQEQKFRNLKQIEMLKSQHQQHKVEKSQLQQELKQTYQYWEQEKSEAKQKIAQLKQNIAKLTVENQTKFKQIKKQLDNTIQEKKNVILQFETNRDKFQNQERTIQNMKEDIETIRNQFQQQLQEITQQLVSKTQQIKTLTANEKSRTEANKEAIGKYEQDANKNKIQFQHLSTLYSQLQNNHNITLNKLTSIRQQKYQLEKNYEDQNKIIDNLKLLISNSENQKSQLELELEEKDNVYKRLLEKITRGEEEHRKMPASQHYLKTVELLEKSRSQLLEYKRLYEQQKKYVKKLKAQLQDRQDKNNQIKNRAEQYCVNQQRQNQSIQRDYLKLQSDYKMILKEKNQFIEIRKQNEQLRQQLRSYKLSTSKSNLKIQQLEDKLKSYSEQFSELQNENDSLKKDVLRSGNDQKMRYISQINQLKQERTILKRQNQMLNEQLVKENQQKIRMKSERRVIKQKDGPGVFQLKAQMQRKNIQIKYINEILGEALNMMGIKKYDLTSKNPDTLRSNLLKTLKNIINQLQLKRDKVKQLELEIQSKSLKLEMAQREYSSVKSKIKQAKTEDSTALSSKIRHKLSTVQSKFANLRQSVQEHPSILGSRDSNSHLYRRL